MSTVKAIETSYAGCRFRSRLEARWAVFFDAMGIEWHYEPEGYELEHRLSNQPGTVRYLPDFWLPGLGLHCEVKGQLSDPELLRLLDCAAALSSPDGGCGGGHDVVVCGQIPRPGTNTHPVVLHMHKGYLMASALPDVNRCAGDPDRDAMGHDYGRDLAEVCDGRQQSVKRALLSGVPHLLTHAEAARYDRAYKAARTARFEHGEIPA